MSIVVLIVADPISVMLRLADSRYAEQHYARYNIFIVRLSVMVPLLKRWKPVISVIIFNFSALIKPETIIIIIIIIICVFSSI
jgi:hypothetical protein